ncbi:MAG: DUF885 family protein [Bryobacteraceae bacterium]
MRLAVCLILGTSLIAAERNPNYSYQVPSDLSQSLESWITRYTSDGEDLRRFYNTPWSTAGRAAFRSYYTAWQTALNNLDFNTLPQDGKVDYLLFRNRLASEVRRLDQEERRAAEIAPLVPFLTDITGLAEARQRVDTIDPARTAALLGRLTKQIKDLTAKPPTGVTKKTAANRAAKVIGQLRTTLREWNAFYTGYDPVFTWWMAEPYKALDSALEQYATTVREQLAGLKKDDKTTILGDPIGREALLSDLASELIPYTPEELIDIANREFAWCTTEMKKASAELGYGDDWRKALEHVKTLHVEPGKQTTLVRDLALEAIDYVESNNLVTVPPLAKATWNMEMMTPEQQKFNPFFLGGPTIIVSYPTNTMTQEEKQMALRGNNIHFSRATVYHELIPGHNLEFFMMSRYRPYRQAFDTPFWMEGWALYWEMLFWDRGFARGPEDRIGMLFWRMHRCARIIFSLSFHLEKMTAQECVQFLIERGGQEPDNASAEVRRSFEGDYGPLYQIAYMVGALQFRALSKEVTLAPREFHDTVLHLGPIPVDMIRATLLNLPLTPNYKTAWRFYPGLR